MAVSILREGDNLLVSFKYDRAIIEKVKGLKVRRWDPKRRAWIIPISQYDELVKALEGYQLELSPPDLPMQIELELKPGLLMSCFICGARVDCDLCEYESVCPVKKAVRYCLCPRCMGVEGTLDAYSMAIAKRLETSAL